LLNSFNIFAWTWLFLLSLSFDLLKFCFSNILDFFLNLVLIWWGMNVVSLKAEMHYKLVNWIIFLIFALKIIIHHPIRFCLWIGDN
jgi:hypothetical protein